MSKRLAALWLLSLAAGVALGATPRARDLGVPFDGAPGPLNAITDVAGVTVGHTTLIESADPEAPGAHRRHRDPAARARQRHAAGLRRPRSRSTAMAR